MCAYDVLEIVYVIIYLKGEGLQDGGLSFGVVGEIGDGAEKMLQGLKSLTRKWNRLQDVFHLKMKHAWH